MKNKLYNYNPYNLKQIYDFLLENSYVLDSCQNIIEDIPESIRNYISPFNKELQAYNWDSYLSCLYEFIDYENSLKRLIELINTKHYLDALDEENRLLREGSQAILYCDHKKDNEYIVSQRNRCRDSDNEKRNNFMSDIYDMYNL